MDGSLATAWCEGARGPGIDEWIEVEVDHPTAAIEVTGGFRKHSFDPLGESDPGQKEKARFEESLRTFRSNGRPAILELTTEKGEVLDRFQVGDRYFGRYSFAVRLAPGKYRLRIAQVHPGARFEDTCIAELRFHGPKARASAGALLPAALRPIAEPWVCRAGPGASLLPQEVTFLGSFPSRASRASVNAPFTCPSNSLRSELASFDSDPQSTSTNGPATPLSSWIRLAAYVFPEPVGPSRKTGMRCFALRTMSSRAEQSASNAGRPPRRSALAPLREMKFARLDCRARPTVPPPPCTIGPG